MTTPTGRLSLKFRLVAATVLAVLLMVKLRVLVPPRRMESGPKLLLKSGGGLTVKLSLAVPLLPRDEVRSPLVLTCVPPCYRSRRLAPYSCSLLPPFRRCS